MADDRPRIQSCPWPRRTGPRRWLVVQSEYRREITAEKEIEAAGFLVYVPRFKTRLRERTGGKRKWIDAMRPLFPSYLFVDAVHDFTAPAWLAKLRGVRDMVRRGDDPVRVPDWVIEQLRKDEGINFRQPYRSLGPAVPFTAGDQVRITDGPFAGFYGLVGLIDPADRITVFIEAFGRASPVHPLTVDQIERT